MKNSKSPRTFGGENLIGKRKMKRPLSTREPIHLILRTHSEFARELFSPLYKKSMKTVKLTANQFQIKIYELAFNFTHVHLVIKLKNKSDYVKFIRALTARLAALARRTLQKKALCVFQHRPYTRIVSWGRDWRRLIEYVLNNQVESGVLNQKEAFESLGEYAISIKIRPTTNG